MRTRNSSWGNRRIDGELADLGIIIAASIMWEVLTNAGIDPAPQRDTGPTWASFLRSQAAAILACDFVVDLPDVSKAYVLAVIERAKGIWGYAPLLVTLANTREVLFLVNRPGNAPSHLDAATWIDRAIDLVCPSAPRVCVRGDTDFSLTANVDLWAEKVDFVFGMDNNITLRAHAETLDEKAWKRLERPTPYETRTGKTRTRRHNRKKEVVKQREFLNLELNYEDVAEFTYKPKKCQRSCRVVVVRKNISRTKGENVLIDEIRYLTTPSPASTTSGSDADQSWEA
ncbi:transposase [Saccharopolyspora shandongensis]|uniref:transposase n=1 Tax=Saccharopolyspora shandongensis TaxID=418495 RepID=UPI0034006713